MTPVTIQPTEFRHRDDIGEWAAGVVVASPEWFTELAAAVIELVALAPAHLAGASLLFQEVFTDVPPNGEAVAWHVRLDDGVITSLNYGEVLDDPELEQTVSWPEGLTMCRMRKAHPDYAELKQRLIDQGHVLLKGTPEGWAVFRELFADLHDRIVLRTA